ncbi:MAG: hypothetical protein ACLU4N_05395 [Butyricimonas faecihominis]
MKVIKNILFMLLAVGMFGSCIKEDMDDCPKYGEHLVVELQGRRYYRDF